MRMYTLLLLLSLLLLLLLLLLLCNIFSLIEYSHEHMLFILCHLLPFSSILFSQLLHFLCAFEWTGAIVRMIFKVLQYSIPYMIIISIVLMGCANAYFILFADLPLSPSSITSDDVFTPVESIGQSLFAVYAVLILSEVQVCVKEHNGNDNHIGNGVL